MSGSSGEEDDEEHQQEATVKLLLRIHAANLPRHGMLKALPDAYAVVTSVSGRASKSGPENQAPATGSDQVMRTVEWGRTELIYKNSHPQWTETFTLDYVYGSECYFYVQVYRLQAGITGSGTTNKPPLSLGNAVCEIGDILGSKNQTKVKRLPKGGVVFCRLEPVKDSHRNCIFRFQFAARELDVGKKYQAGMFRSAPDTIVRIAKKHPNSTRQAWITVYRSSPVEESLDPTWDIGELDLESVCNGDVDRPLRISVLVHKKNNQDHVVAECETTLRHILNTQRDFNENESEAEASKRGFRLARRQQDNTKQVPKMVGRLQVPLAQLIDIAKEKEVDLPPPRTLDNHKSISSMSLLTNDITHDPYTIDIAALPTPIAAPATFQDYVQDGGCKLDFCVAIDFTSSNGDPRIPGTLHDQNSDSVNVYEETIVSIGHAVAVYSDQFAVWGFGAKFGGVTRHLFQCGPNPQVKGVAGILGAYKGMFKSDLTMSGPTCFDKVIQAAAVRATKHQKEQSSSCSRYSVLLVITDGISQELQETKRKLAVYSDVPLSVIFVGVGRAEFKSMYDLCGNDGTTRENTTFVEFRHHQHDPTSLGRAALADVPNQLVQYMVKNGIQPKTKR